MKGLFFVIIYQTPKVFFYVEIFKRKIQENFFEGILHLYNPLFGCVHY